jgi:hypothetical protein
MTTDLTNLQLNIMSNATSSGTSAGRQPVADVLIVALLLKLIGARADVCCWHINGDADPCKKESSLAHLLGISQVQPELIMKMCGECFDKRKGCCSTSTS